MIHSARRSRLVASMQRRVIRPTSPSHTRTAAMPLTARLCKQVRSLSTSQRYDQAHQRPAAQEYSLHRQKRAEADTFLRDSLPRLLSKVYDTYSDRDGKVLEFLQPDVLQSQFDLQVRNESMSNPDLEKLAERVIKYSIKTGHPYFFNQLFQGVDGYSLSASILNEALNGSAYTYEIAPVVSMIEHLIVNKVGSELIGYPQGHVDGIFCPGGSLANMYGISLARHDKYPESKTKGMQGLPPVKLFTSDLSHYSVTKGMFFMGLGMDNMVRVKTDSVGRMIPEELDKEIKQAKSQGYEPLMVNATSGTTVFGAYDPLDELADVCRDNGDVWLHVDACWGGAVLLSDKLRYKMKGMDKTDSICWDPHKMLGSILQCALIVTKHTGVLAEAHSANARYLFQQDKVYDCSYDTGDKSIQCGRKMDAFKLWLQWKAYGSDAMAQAIETCFDNALYLRDRLAECEGFRLLLTDPECTNVCFWYIPESMRGQEETEDWWHKLSTVAPAIKGEMQRQGTMMIGYQPQGHYVNFFRMVLSNASNTKQDMDHILQVISQYGEKFFPK